METHVEAHLIFVMILSKFYLIVKLEDRQVFKGRTYNMMSVIHAKLHISNYTHLQCIPAFYLYFLETKRGSEEIK